MTTARDPILRYWRESEPNDRLAHLVKDAGRAFNRALQAQLSTHDISFGHWTFLRILWQHDGLTQRQLSEQAGVMEPTTHAALSAMEARGLITRAFVKGNAKNRHVFLTVKGKTLQNALVPLAETVNTSAIAGLTEKEVALLRTALLKIIENLSTEGK